MCGRGLLPRHRDNNRLIERWLEKSPRTMRGLRAGAWSQTETMGDAWWGAPRSIPGDPGQERAQHPCSEPPKTTAEGARSQGGCRQRDTDPFSSSSSLFSSQKRGAKSEKNKIVFSSVLESTWINNSSRNWAAETINFLWTQPKKDAGRRWLPSPGRGSGFLGGRAGGGHRPGSALQAQ